MRNNWRFIVLLILSALSLYLNVGSYGVVESSDARYAEIAREMFKSGDYLHPDLLNIHHYHKPPVTYQITAIAYSIFGVNSFGARFFLQLAVLFQLVLIYAMARALFDSRKVALWTAAIYFSFPLVLASSRNLTTDAFLTTFALLSMYAWVRYRKNNQRAYLYLFTFSLAMGFLTKGPVVFIVPVPFVIAYNLVEKPKAGLSIHHLLAWLLFLILAISWYLYLVVQNIDFLDYFLDRQTLDRMLSKEAFNRSEPFWYFFVLAPVVGMPWSLIVPFFLIRRIREIRLKSLPGVMILSILIPLIFYSISSSKRILYILPFYSLLALLTAYFMTTLSEKVSRRLSRIMLGFVLLFAIGFITARFIPTGYHIPLYLPVAGFLEIILSIGIYKSRWFNADTRPVLMSFIFAIMLVTGSSAFMASNELKMNTPAPIADFIKEIGLEKRNILVYNIRLPSIAFHLGKPVISLFDGSRSLDRETQFETDTTWKEFLIDLNDESDLKRLRGLMEQPSVLIYHKKVPGKRKWMLAHYKNFAQFEKWGLYY